MAKTISIVDDASIIRKLVTLTLSREGYSVIEAVDGKDALQKINGMALDMIVTDLNMPEMDGIEFIKQIRSRSEYAFTPIVMLTTESQEHRQQEGQRAGASGWLLKPFDARQLMYAVRKFIG